MLLRCHLLSWCYKLTSRHINRRYSFVDRCYWMVEIAEVEKKRNQWKIFFFIGIHIALELKSLKSINIGITISKLSLIKILKRKGEGEEQCNKLNWRTTPEYWIVVSVLYFPINGSSVECTCKKQKDFYWLENAHETLKDEKEDLSTQFRSPMPGFEKIELLSCTNSFHLMILCILHFRIAGIQKISFISVFSDNSRRAP